MSPFLFTVSHSSSRTGSPPPVLLRALVIAALLPPTQVQPRETGFAFSPQRKGEITATLALQVAEQGPAPGRGRVQLTLDVTGPVGLEVEEPRLEDALAGWRVEWAASSLAENEGRTVWEETLGLVQVKPGVVPLPGVVLRFRAGPGAPREEASWQDLLLEARKPPDPIRPEPLPPSAWPARLRLAGVILALAFGLALLGRAGQRWLIQRPGPLPLHERALAGLEDAPSEPVAGVTHLDAVLRGYLEERFGVEALRKTTREVLDALASVAALPPEQRSALAELLARCDVLKFASGEGIEGLRAAREQARAFIRATAPVGQAGRVGEGANPGEIRVDARDR